MNLDELSFNFMNKIVWDNWQLISYMQRRPWHLVIPLSCHTNMAQWHDRLVWVVTLLEVVEKIRYGGYNLKKYEFMK